MESLEIQKTIHDIQTLKIQGASQVRWHAIHAFQTWTQQHTPTKVNEFKKNARRIIQLFVHARPTEPAVQNIVRRLEYVIAKAKTVPELQQKLLNECDQLNQEHEKAKKQIAKNGAHVIKKNSVVFTHCHSHSVENILVEAKTRIHHVIATETRPLYQGHITVSNLTRARIPCTLIVDSAVHAFMDQADYLLTGADAVQANGDVINKIGTSTISAIANLYDVPHYVVTSTEKFDFNTLKGKTTRIEQRNPMEIWNTRLHKLTIENPAFDITPAHYMKGIITEHGIIAPHQVKAWMNKNK